MRCVFHNAFFLHWGVRYDIISLSKEIFMNSKNLIFCAMFGAIVAVSASYANVDLSMEQCMNSEEYVWVEKDSVCIPKSTCPIRVDGEVTRAYCSKILVPMDASKREMVINNYVEKVLNTSVSSIDTFTDMFDGGVETIYHAVHTSDGGYIVFPELLQEGYLDQDFEFFKLAAETYGIEYELVFGGSSFGPRVIVRASESECQDVKDFASALADHEVEGYEYNSDGWCALQQGVD